MTEPAEEQPDPSTITWPARIDSDGRAAEKLPEPF
jgi:hypothetical protein